MFKNLFSFNGRIRRTEYGISLIIYVISYLTIRISAEAGDGPKAILLVFIPLLWFSWSQGAKRCHDLGKSGWWQIIPFYFFWLLFEDGNPGENEYGYSPKERESFGPEQYESPFPDKPSINGSYSNSDELKD